MLGSIAVTADRMMRVCPGYNGRVTSPAAIKSEIRAAVRAARIARGEDRRVAARAGLAERLSDLALTREARSLSCFLPTSSEPDTRGFLEWAATRGIDVVLPSSRSDGLLDWIRPSGDGTVRGAHGIDEPLGEHLGPGALAEVDLMLVPAAAVDLRGNRLGWGRGYFDRALASLPHALPVFAVVFDDEVFESVPVEAHDMPLTGVVTPERTLVF
jgi:5-formyltetrahydrofolate cyclo-ligase